MRNSSGNILDSNVIRYNARSGIMFYPYATSNTITNNTIESNPVGVYLVDSTANEFTDNAMAGNTENLYVAYESMSPVNPDYFNNDIDTSNTVEGKPVYYLYGVSNQTYDGDVIGDIGMFWCISCNNVTVQNAVLADNNYSGVLLRNTTNSTVQNITLPRSNQNGIFLQYSSGNDIIDNTIYSSAFGIKVNSSSNNNVSNNIISKSFTSISDDGSNTYSDNQFLYSIVNPTLTFTESVCEIDLNGTANFTIAMKNPDGSSCDDCSYSVVTYPSEPSSLDYSDNGSGVINGTFIPTKRGTYSLAIQTIDSANNLTKRNYLFFVDALGSETQRYYIRRVAATHGQPVFGVGDSGVLLTSPPTSPPAYEQMNCIATVVNAIDEIPYYPIANLSDVYVNGWYKLTASGFVGFQRYGIWDGLLDDDAKLDISAAPDFIQIERDFEDLNWAMDYPHSWYWLSLKLTPCYYNWQTTAVQPSYADFIYFYTTTPTLKSISNENIMVLSATEPEDEPGNATIILDGTGATDTSTDIVLDNYNRPFFGYTTTINSDGTATLAATDIDGETTIRSAKMDLTPSSGTVEVDIRNWNTSGNYYKEWEETVSPADITVEHTIGDLAANTYYTVKIDDIVFNTYLSNASGEITFSHVGGSVFKIVKTYYTISGKVILKGGSSAVTKVLITLSDGANEVTNPNTNGNYIFVAERELDYTITPSLKDYYFFPFYYSYTSLDDDQSDQDFTGYHKDYDSDEDGIPDWAELMLPDNEDVASKDGDDGDYYCFLATLFGTAMVGENKVLCELRKFRDGYLLTNPIGESFSRTYYKISPTIAEFIKGHPILKKTIRSVLGPLIRISGKITE